MNLLLNLDFKLYKILNVKIINYYAYDNCILRRVIIIQLFKDLIELNKSAAIECLLNYCICDSLNASFN